MYYRMLEASVLFSQFVEQERILDSYLMYFCEKMQPNMTPAGATDLTQCDRETEMTARIIPNLSAKLP